MATNQTEKVIWMRVKLRHFQRYFIYATLMMMTVNVMAIIIKTDTLSQKRMLLFAMYNDATIKPYLELRGLHYKNCKTSVIFSSCLSAYIFYNVYINIK
jgi:hypothetical protein